jgi:hypothetical protein
MDTNKLENPSDFETPIQNETTKKTATPLAPDKKSDQKTSQRTLDELLRAASGDEEIYHAIKSGSRKRFLSTYKKDFIMIAVRENYTMRQIGEHISVSEVAIYKMSVKE